ncbi:protein phosphatase 2C-related protein [Tieghemostelium lacteum]|uniref:Protein phosphatase 2C-related protein n=1 Tax=Tieghemostelium lacteum TaxID=361077 RepID=A0A151ZG00_TIELA|nr:protein phosphatase 2C-related protein [Tieghemostelium lacteum]|eukprot:KYQ92794.1 protein phosphatase 2C-related protein [Tieghemostelium lacteum]
MIDQQTLVNSSEEDQQVVESGEQHVFQSKFVDSNYLDCSSSTSSVEDLEEEEEELVIGVRSPTLNSSNVPSTTIPNVDDNVDNCSSTFTIQIQEQQTSTSTTIINNTSSSSGSSKTKLVRNPITLVEEYHSTSSLSSYSHSSCSVSNENIFAAIKEMDDSMNLFSTTGVDTSGGTTTIFIDQDRPGRKLSISASSIPLPLSSTASTVSPLTLSCSSPSLPGVSHSLTSTTVTASTAGSGNGASGLISSQEKEIILIQSQPDLLKKSKYASAATRTKTIFKFKKSSSKSSSDQINSSGSNTNIGSSNEAISPSASTNSNLSTSSSSSSSSNSEKKEKKKSWRLRLKKSLSHEKNLNKSADKEMEPIQEEKKEEEPIIKDKEQQPQEEKENIQTHTPTTTTTTTTTSSSTSTTTPTLLHDSGEQIPHNHHHPPFLSTSLPPIGGGLSDMCDLESDQNPMDEDFIPRGGRGRSNAFYMKGAPLINQTNGEFKISLPKPPSLPNLVQLSIPSILPKESYSLLSKPVGVFSKFKSKQSLSTNNLNNHINNSNNNNNNNINSLNIANKIIKNNSSRFIIGFADTIGRRPQMEDESVIFGGFRGHSDEDYFALFDGHGGKEASQMSSTEFHKILVDKLKSNTNNPVKSLKESFQGMNSLLLEKGVKGGTTAVIALFLGKKGYIANVGDSRAVLCRDGSAVRVSLDHKPNLPKEEERIRSMGGTVITTTTSSGVQTSRVNGQLAVSRALGDHFLHPFVSCEPDIHGPINIDSHSKNQFMIMACDGLWDVMSDDEAVQMVLPLINDPESACIKLRQEAYNLGSTDNISIIVIKFPTTQE